jgi:hypothetical protein
MASLTLTMGVGGRVARSADKPVLAQVRQTNALYCTFPLDIHVYPIGEEELLQVQVARWGHSLGVRIPKHVAERGRDLF